MWDKCDKANACWNTLVKKLKEGRFTNDLKEAFWNDGGGFAEVIALVTKHKRQRVGGRERTPI